MGLMEMSETDHILDEQVWLGRGLLLCHCGADPNHWTLFRCMLTDEQREAILSQYPDPKDSWSLT